MHVRNIGGIHVIFAKSSIFNKNIYKVVRSEVCDISSIEYISLKKKREYFFQMHSYKETWLLTVNTSDEIGQRLL